MAVGVGLFASGGIFGPNFFPVHSGSVDWGDWNGPPAHGETPPGSQPHAGAAW